PDPAQGDQGRLVPLCAELFPTLPSRRADGAGDRHVDLPPRLPLRRARHLNCPILLNPLGYSTLGRLTERLSTAGCPSVQGGDAVQVGGRRWRGIALVGAGALVVGACGSSGS